MKSSINLTKPKVFFVNQPVARIGTDIFSYRLVGAVDASGDSIFVSTDDRANPNPKRFDQFVQHGCRSASTVKSCRDEIILRRMGVIQGQKPGVSKKDSGLLLIFRYGIPLALLPWKNTRVQ
jgi:hypothetical protein